MPYITREDGEHFVIPSYRDVLPAKQKNVLKKDILLLSQNYGEYITLQRKSPTQYEVAFSPDTGYLLGETVWHHFKKPADMIYCEMLPNGVEAILVIVKSGSVYLDGSFTLDSISEELIIFLTQQNNFEIYIYGNVPISEKPEEGKFNFEPSSVKSFTILDKPVFPILPLLKPYQLQLVDIVLRAQGIGVFPLKQLLLGVAIAFGIWLLWSYFHTSESIVTEIAPPELNPYQLYATTLMAPAPDEELAEFVNVLELFYTMPGWYPVMVKYEKGNAVATVQTDGSKLEVLFDWAKENNATVDIKTDGIYVSRKIDVKNRPAPTHIYPLKEVTAALIDRIASVYPGNRLKLSQMTTKGAFTDEIITITLDGVSPMILNLISRHFKDLPIILQKINLAVDKGSLTGTITIQALGS